MSFSGVLILIYVPGIKDYFWFGAMRAVDWLFPIGAGIVYLAVYEVKKWSKRRKERKMSEQLTTNN